MRRWSICTRTPCTPGNGRARPPLAIARSTGRPGVLAYFDALGQAATPPGASHPVATREALKAYDPELHALVDETMAYDGHVDWRFQPAHK